MAVKQVWKAIFGRVGCGMTHRWTDGTLTGASYVVTLDVKVCTGPETGRNVRVELSPADAREMAESLLAYADRAEELNDLSGCVPADR